MPSGFQQDTNQLQPALYRVVIDMSNNSYNVYCRGGTGTCYGVVNPFNWDNWSGSNLPTSDDNALRLARGNLRWQRIVEELGKHADCQILDVDVTNDSDYIADDEPTQIAFTVKYDRYGIDNADTGEKAGILQAEQKFLQQINSGSNNSPYDNNNCNHTQEAIEEAVMRALIENVTRSVRVYQESTGNGIQAQVTAADVTDGGNYSDLRDSISVVGPLDGTTVINQSEDTY